MSCSRSRCLPLWLQQILLVPSSLLPLRPAASWRLHRRPAGSRSCDSAPSPPPVTRGDSRQRMSYWLCDDSWKKVLRHQHGVMEWMQRTDSTHDEVLMLFPLRRTRLIVSSQHNDTEVKLFSSTEMETCLKAHSRPSSLPQELMNSESATYDDISCSKKPDATQVHASGAQSCRDEAWTQAARHRVWTTSASSDWTHWVWQHRAPRGGNKTPQCQKTAVSHDLFRHTLQEV